MSSSRRSRTRRAGSSLSSSSSRSISEDQISELLSRLQALLPESQTRNGAHRVSTLCCRFAKLPSDYASWSPRAYSWKQMIISNAGLGGEGAAGYVQLHQEPEPGGGQPQRDARRAALLRRLHQRPGRHHQEPPHVISSGGRSRCARMHGRR